MTLEEQETFMLEAVEGLMTLMQALVMALDKSGTLDTAEYSRVLLGMRESLVEPGSLQDVLFQRMLRMLVEGDPKVLVRRWGMHAVPTEPRPPRETE